MRRHSKKSRKGDIPNLIKMDLHIWDVEHRSYGRRQPNNRQNYSKKHFLGFRGWYIRKKYDIDFLPITNFFYTTCT